MSKVKKQFNHRKYGKYKLEREERKEKEEKALNAENEAMDGESLARSEASRRGGLFFALSQIFLKLSRTKLSVIRCVEKVLNLHKVVTGFRN